MNNNYILPEPHFEGTVKRNGALNVGRKHAGKRAYVLFISEISFSDRVNKPL